MKRLTLYSQNFLRSPRFVKTLLNLTNITPNDVVYDIGAGTGVIASALAPKCRSVVAVELDPRMVARLRTNTQTLTNVLVYQTDFLLMPLPSTPYKVFANIPFSLSAAIVRKLTQETNPPDATYLIVQREFARKLLPDSKDYTNLLAIMLGVEFEVRIRYHLRQSDFLPQPLVTPVLLEIVRRSAPLLQINQMSDFRDFVTSAYGNARTLEKALVKSISRQRLAAFVAAEKLPRSVRPSQLGLSQWVRLYRSTKA